MKTPSLLLMPAVRLVCGLLGVALVIPHVQGATWRVRKDGTGNYTTIQSCVNAMVGGDTCLVGPGVYAERVTFPSGKSGSAGRMTVLKAETPRTADTLGFDTANCNYLRIEGFNISVAANQTGYPNGVGLVVRSSNLEIVSNYVHDIPYFALFGSGTPTNVYVGGNRIYQAGYGMYVVGKGWLVEANDIERLRWSSPNGDADYLRFFGSNHVIRSNYFHGTFASEIGPAHVDGFQTYDDNGATAQHVRLEGNRLDGFYHQGFMLEGLYYSNSFDILICNNVLRQATTWGVCARRIRDLKIYHNLFIDINSYAFGFLDGATGEVKNNIFYNITDWYSTPASYGTRNLWYRQGVTVGSRFTGDVLNADPRFVNAATTNYHLQAGSPAMNAGVALAEVTVDMDGVARPQGAGTDIGPFEYISTSPSARLTSPARQGASLVFTLTGGAGLTWRIEASSNLQQWTSVKTVSVTSGSAAVTNSATAARQFYRAVLLP